VLGTKLSKRKSSQRRRFIRNLLKQALMRKRREPRGLYHLDGGTDKKSSSEEIAGVHFKTASAGKGIEKGKRVRG
jgi:hypothetical protein